MGQTLTAERESSQAEVVTMIEADATLSRIADEFTQRPSEALTIVTQHGRPALAVLPWEYYESLMETLEIMGDEEAMAAIRRFQRGTASREEIKTYSLEQIKQELGV
jgi:antitoxin YefM